MEFISSSKKSRTPSSDFQSNMNKEPTPQPIPQDIPKTNLLTTVELDNPGIGDSTFIYRDNYLRQGLSQFPPSSYELELIVDPNQKIKCCGGYNYRLKIYTHQSEIQQFIKEWYSDQNLDQYRYIPKNPNAEPISTIDPSNFVDLDKLSRELF